MTQVLALWLMIMLSAGAARAEDGSVPIELQWLKVAGEIISTVGMPGVIGGLLYLLKLQREDREKERKEQNAEMAEERAFSRKLQDERATIASASADRLATVSVSGSNAITANTTLMATVVERSQTTIDIVRPLPEKHDRILAGLDRVAAKVGAG